MAAVWDREQHDTTRNATKNGQTSAAITDSPTSKKRKRSSITSPQNRSPKADLKTPGAKRACNECRQQKLRCDVQLEPYKNCSRCVRLHLECQITPNFHRIDKRNRNAEMERELSELRAKLADKSPHVEEARTSSHNREAITPSSAVLLARQRNHVTSLHQGVADSLLDLRHSSDSNNKSNYKRLGPTVLTQDQVNDLFRHYFDHHHPFLPLLDPSKSPDHFFELSELLFWSIIAVASRRWPDDPTLLTGLAPSLNYHVWETIAAVPQNYHVVKALCLLCTWPLPTKSSASDPTFMLSGLMMQIAMQTGLHRPSSTRDFTRTRVEWQEEDIKDRLNTWAACNIVSQNVSTGYGQPPNSHYDYALVYEDLVPEMHWRLRIERFANQVSTFLYQRSRDPTGAADEFDRPSWISIMAQTYRDLEREVRKRDSPIEILYLQAAWLHCTLSAFFDSPSNPDYIRGMLKVYFAARDFLQTVIDLCSAPREGNPAPADIITKITDRSNLAGVRATGQTFTNSLKYAGFYIMQMILAGAFTFMKLLNSFFAAHMDVEASRRIFNQTVRVVRASSINNNDLPARLAEVLAQLWRSSGAGLRSLGENGDSQVDSSLQLKVRCRMSMSLVYDSVWRWREQFQFSTSDGAHLDPSNPTRIDVTPVPGDSSSTSNVGNGIVRSTSTPGAHDSNGGLLDPTLGEDVSLANSSGNNIMSGLGGPGPGLGVPDGVVDLSYDVFDPLTWMLDGGGLDFPYNDAGFGVPETGDVAGNFFSS